MTLPHPHPKLVERQGHAEAIDDGSRLQAAAFGFAKEEKGTQSGQQEDAVAEVVDVTRATERQALRGVIPNESPARSKRSRRGIGNPLKETTATGRARCAKAGPCRQARYSWRWPA